MPVSAVSTITIRVLLFAGYADALGFESVELSLEAPASVGDALKRLRAFPGGNRLPAKPMCALNLNHVGHEAGLSGGDELAVLPPLAGG
jgi:molybdopterin converting factor small subunit